MTFTVQYPYRRPFDLHIAILDHGAEQEIVGIDNERSECVDSIAYSQATTCDGESPLEDALIEAGYLKVIGFANDKCTIAQIEFDDEWLGTLPVYRMLSNKSDEAENVIEVGYEKRYRMLSPIARLTRKNYVWQIAQWDETSWRITGYHKTDPDKSFSTDCARPLVETWLEAMRLERAMDEFVNAGKRIAEKYGVSFINNLIEHVAAGYWYLEG